jgi:hypothetical protein
MTLAAFENTLTAVLADRFGGTWKVERLDRPAPPLDREGGRFADAADERPLAHVGAAANEHAVEHRG